jgi:hypothetical protein
MSMTRLVELTSARLIRFAFSGAFTLFTLVTIAYAASLGHADTHQENADSSQGLSIATDYVGSKTCAECHAAIYNAYSETDMGRSMTEVTPAFLQRIPNSAEIFDAKLNRHFGVSVRDGKLYQQNYETAADGKEIFRDTQKIQWIIGSGANGFGAIVRRGDALFEAPLSFYSKTHRWALSPGYESYDFGFSRPILPQCIGCHSGRARAIPNGNGRFLDPPFAELAVGCENCHGPGGLHASRMRERAPHTKNSSYAIVNPAKLSSWLADNICMSCHQTGDARVLQPGKNFQDFRPGEPLDRTLAVLTVPWKRGAAPRSDLLQHYFSMTLSKCYRGSQGKLGCITCHDPHSQPNPRAAPAVFRSRCLTCHTEESCAVPSTIRKRKDPPDDCAGCHMPKRDLQEIPHSSLTNHRIIRDSSEPYPESAYALTTPEMPDLIHLDAMPGAKHGSLPQITLLQAYGQLVGPHPEYRQPYLALAERLRTAAPDNVFVLEALAFGAVAKQSAQGMIEAIDYLIRAIQHGSTLPDDFEQCANLLIRAGRFDEAETILQQGMKTIPHDGELYRLLALSYLSQHKATEATKILELAAETFPENQAIRELLSQSRIAEN